MKFSDKVTLENTLFVSKSINNLLPSLFNDWFLFSSDQHNYETSCSSLGNLHKSSYKTNLHGKSPIIVSAINAWNNSQKLLKISLRHLSPNKIKKLGQMSFFQSIEMIFVTFQMYILNCCLMVSKFCKHYICFSLFSLLFLSCNIHFPNWLSFDILN